MSTTKTIAKPIKEEYQDDFEKDEDHEEEEEEEAEEAEEVEGDEGDEEEEDEEEEDEEEEDEEEEDEEDDEEEEEEDSSSAKLSIKVSREGEQKVKLFIVKKSTKFTSFRSEVEKRFGYTSSNDLSLYVIDPSGDRVDIDEHDHFKNALKSYWKKSSKGTVPRIYLMDTATEAARPVTSSGAALMSTAPGTLSVPTMRAAATQGSTFAATMDSTSSSAIARTISDMTEAFSLGKTVEWKRMSILGKGSFGTVYEAITNDGKIVAVKVQDLPQDDDGDSQEVKNLVSEINLMKLLSHRNIVAYYGCQVKEQDSGAKQMEIFLEYCSGGSLTTIRRRYDTQRGRLSMPLVRTYTKQVLDGLAYLHARGVIHRDIKSDNVLISATGEAKLADFGCSKRVGTATMAAGGGGNNNDAALFQTMVGTPLFMAPEVMNDSGPGYNKSADIWSVGCLIIELLGCKPWLVQGTNLFQVMFQISQSKDMPTGIPKGTPELLLSFFRRCFDRDPAARASATELLSHPWMTCPASELEEVNDDA